MKQIDQLLGGVTKKNPERKAILQRRKGCKNELHRIKEQLVGIVKAKRNVADLEFAQRFVKIARRDLKEEMFDNLLEKTAQEM